MGAPTLPATITNADGEVIFAGDLAAPRPDLLPQARALVVGAGAASTPELQRALGLSFQDAIAILERLQAAGVVGVPDQDGVRRVLAQSVELDEPSDPRLFTDLEAVLAAAGDADAFASGILSSINDPANDAEVRELAYPGVEALHFVLSEIRAPSPAERELMARLAAWADELVEGRATERLEIAELAQAARA